MRVRMKSLATMMQGGSIPGMEGLEEGMKGGRKVFISHQWALFGIGEYFLKTVAKQVEVLMSMMNQNEGIDILQFLTLTYDEFWVICMWLGLRFAGSPRYSKEEKESWFCVSACRVWCQIFTKRIWRFRWLCQEVTHFSCSTILFFFFSFWWWAVSNIVLLVKCQHEFCVSQFI